MKHAWGGMLRAGEPYLRTQPHLAIFPGLMIMLAVLGSDAMGDALLDIGPAHVEPRPRRTIDLEIPAPYPDHARSVLQRDAKHFSETAKNGIALVNCVRETDGKAQRTWTTENRSQRARRWPDDKRQKTQS